MFGFLKTLTSSVISPKIGLDMLRGQIENTLGFKVESYSLHVNCETETVDFIIPVKGEEHPRKYPYDDKAGLGVMIKTAIASEVKNGDIVDFIIIDYTLTGSEAKIYYRDDSGTKQFLTSKF